jgi:tetratricopeptide (TPR) repeat protein
MKRSSAATLAAPVVLVAVLLCGCPPKMSESERLTREGNGYFKSENYDGAVQAYSRALELEPGQPGVLVNRGNARMLLGDEQGALADYQAAIEIDPAFANAYANRGILRDRMGDLRGAMADYRRALQLEPKLGKPPGILKRILYNPPTETIKDRLDYLEAEGPPSED